MRLPIGPSLWLWSYLAPFLRYWDLLAKNCLFFLPLSHSAPRLPLFPLELCGEVNHEETKVMGAILQWRPHDRSVSHIDTVVTVPACDRRADGRTDSYSALYSKLCWRAVKMPKQDASLSQGPPRDAYSKFRYLSNFTTASHGFHCDSNAFELTNNINHVKITVLNTSIYCL